MKKIYLSVFMSAIVIGVNAQQYRQKLTTKVDMNPTMVKPTPNKPAEVTEKVTIWSDDFSNASNWTLTNQSTGSTLDFSFETNPDLSALNVTTIPSSLTPFAATTATNGFLFVSSDAAPGNADGDGTPIRCQATSTTIDCSGYPSLVLKFQHNYRWWQDARGVRVSGDGGSTWTDYPMTYTTGSGLTFPNGDPYPGNQNSDNPNYEIIDISTVAGNSANVVVQFYYDDDDFWGWWWAVDDVEIAEKPDNDVQNLAAWFVGENNEGIEYGRTPLDQLDASYDVGAQIFNFGVNDQTNVTLTSDYTSFSYVTDTAFLDADSTIFLESNEMPALSVGLYNGVYTVVSDLESSGPEFANNVYLRNWEVTNNVYSTDGIGNEPAGYEALYAVGTDYFTGGEDGLVAANMYHIKNTEQVTGLYILIDVNNTDVGAEVYGSIKDTATWFADDMTPLFNTDPHTVNATDIANGYIYLPFQPAPTGITLNPGAYMAAVEMYSNGNSSDIRILDDAHVAQPSYASMIYLPGDQVYSNGTAYAIRLQVNDNEELGLNEEVVGVSVYPNPSTGVVTISNDNNVENTIIVHDLAGKVVLTKTASEATTIDLSANGTGVYTVTVNNEKGSFVERVVIK